MKQLSNLAKYIAVFFICFFAPLIAWGQDSASDVDLDFETIVIDNGPFYAQLWFWIVVGIVFLLILIALIRGGGRKKVEVKRGEKQYEKDK